MCVKWFSSSERATFSKLSHTCSEPSAAIWRRIAADTTSRGWSSSQKRSPAALSRIAPSPRADSLMRKLRPGLPVQSVVGWICTKSMCSSSTPCSAATRQPSPVRQG